MVLTTAGAPLLPEEGGSLTFEILRAGGSEGDRAAEAAVASAIEILRTAFEAGGSEEGAGEGAEAGAEEWIEALCRGEGEYEDFRYEAMTEPLS